MDIVKTKQNKIYKYIPFSENALKLLVNNELYFSIPDNLNDPLDCKFAFDNFIVKDDDITNYYKNASGLTEEEKLSYADFHIKNPNRKSISKRIVNDWIRKLRKQYGLSCFSEINDDILMWSHYANGHTGICLEFEWKKDEKTFQGNKVNYVDKLPVFDFSKNEKVDFYKVFFSKMNNWCYEREIRSVFKIEYLRTINFNPKALSGVIFGEKISHENKKTIRKIVKMHDDYENVNFYASKANLIKNHMEIWHYLDNKEVELKKKLQPPTPANRQ